MDTTAAQLDVPHSIGQRESVGIGSSTQERLRSEKLSAFMFANCQSCRSAPAYYLMLLRQRQREKKREGSTFFGQFQSSVSSQLH